MIFQKTFSQTYNEMLSNDIEWQVTSCYNGCKTDIYFLDGDTIYNGYNYSILNGYHFISKTFWLRENIQNQNIYMSFLQNNIRKEVLLYDFDLQKGDSINIFNPISPFITNPGYYVVDSLVWLQLQDGLYYEVFYLSSLSLNINESAVWIEGIGSLSLINAPGGTPNVNGAGKLSCYFNSGNLVYSQLDSIKNCVLVNPVLSSQFLNSNINNRKIISIQDLWARETKANYNKVLFYIYDDGTVEKRIVIE
tara:strand:+ start:437 stop:1186 length:750 start_codon:yes stop_codon:yes gene_type:complete